MASKIEIDAAEATHDLHLDGQHGDAQPRRDVLLGDAFHLSKDHDLAAARGQRIDCAGEHSQFLTRAGVIDDAWGWIANRLDDRFRHVLDR